MMTQLIEQRRGGMELGAPFYAPPARKTSAEIIREARAALHLDDPLKNGASVTRVGPQRRGVRTVNTKRPFTPRERERTLFGGQRSSNEERPPSSFTLSPLHFETSEANGRNSASLSGRLQPLQKTLDGHAPDSGSPDGLARLPSLSSRRVHRHQFRALSLCDLPEEGEDVDDRTPRKGSLPPPRSFTINTLHTTEETEPNDDSLMSDNSSPSPESRPEHIQVVKKSPLITDSSLYKHFLIQDDVEVSDLDSSLKIRREFDQGRKHEVQETQKPAAPTITLTETNEKAKELSRPPSRTKKSGEVRRKRSISKRPGVDRDWRHAVEIEEDASAENKEEHLKEQSKSNTSPRQEPVDQTVYYEERVNPVLDEIGRAMTCGVEDGVLAELVDKLYKTLESGGLLGRHFKYRSQVLRTVFKLVDREHGGLLANIARVMLSLKVSGNNLMSVCKLIFKVTRHDSNDSLFLGGNLLDLLLEAVACVPPLEQPEACVYGYGALKFLTMNSQLVVRLLHRGILELLVLHMKLIVNHMREHGKVPEQTGYALVQLTGTLRHVSSCERAFPLLLVTGAVTQVCDILVTFSRDADVVANVVRILSIVSTQEECCAAAAAHPGLLQSAVEALQQHSANPAIVVRLAYALGNMMANSDEARWQLFSVEGFTESLLDLLTDYLKRDREHQAGDLHDPIIPPSGSPEDVMVKLIRVLANVAVHPRAGPVLARSKTCLTLMVTILRHKAVEESEELVLSSLATLNNLTFYTRSQTASVLHTDLADCLCDMLPMDHVEGLVETIRVFGNLTHFKEVRDILTRKEVVEVLVEMLDCDSRELVYVCAGVLVNMMSDASRRSIFHQENGVLRMIDVMQYFGYGDWQLCSLACQVLWNYCASSADVHGALGEKETNKLVCILEEFLDDDSYFNNPEVFSDCDNETREVVYQLWEDFAQVATKLLERIEDTESSLPVVQN